MSKVRTSWAYVVKSWRWRLWKAISGHLFEEWQWEFSFSRQPDGCARALDGSSFLLSVRTLYGHYAHAQNIESFCELRNKYLVDPLNLLHSSGRGYRRSMTLIYGTRMSIMIRSDQTVLKWKNRKLGWLLVMGCLFPASWFWAELWSEKQLNGRMGYRACFPAQITHNTADMGGKTRLWYPILPFQSHVYELWWFAAYFPLITV